MNDPQGQDQGSSGQQPPDQTTYEEASRCPKCEKPGEVVRVSPAKDRRGKPVKVHQIFCRNQLCKWLDTSWLVQVNEDGSIPEPYSALGPKKFQKLSPETETKVREAMEQQLDAETRPGGGEIRGRG